MQSVTSVSGGKTSAYMALHYPTDHYVFACVLTNHKGSISKDKALIQECQNRIPHFVASHENDQTLRVVLDLEQELGKQIKWVASEFALEDFVQGVTDLPGYRSGKPRLFNSLTRFCTVQQKIMPIAAYCHNFIDAVDPVLMNLGFRYDEPKRVENWNCKNDRYRMALSCPLAGGNWKYKEFEWRISDFPLYRDRIMNADVKSFWQKKGWNFPEVSNCRFCPFHSDFQLQLQAQQFPDNLDWWMQLEAQTGHTFGKRPLADRINQPLLNIFDSPCACTD